ncbi:hypothetical protein HAYMO_241 [Serratia phage vB_SmaM_Haymo]|nr:hypothetical protein HAYMO_241 [Serratia phage vB_SmaM_Haymo]
MSVMNFEKFVTREKNRYSVYKLHEMYVMKDNDEIISVLRKDRPLDSETEIVVITERGESGIWYLGLQSGNMNNRKEIKRLLKRNAPKGVKFEFFEKIRFKIDGNQRFLTSAGNRIAEGAMNEDFNNWRGPFSGRQWKEDLGGKFKDYLKEQFDLQWAHKAICQRRGEYQYLPDVALFFDTTKDLVLKLIKRPNDKDSCEGFYVGTLYGKPFGYHIDGNQPKITQIDDYVRRSVADITQTPIESVELEGERFATDVNYDRVADRWILNSTIGEIGHLVKGVRPDNTCDIRKHVKWTYRVNGFALNEIPLLEPLLVESFLRGYHRLIQHTAV